jgi:hypothetical protein
MLSILRVLKQHCSAHSKGASLASAIDRDAFKIIYVQVALLFCPEKLDHPFFTFQGTDEGFGF